MNKRLAVLGVMITLVVTGTAVAAPSATATASATIVAPIAITNTTALQFGQIVPAAVAGTVTVPAVTGTPVRTFTNTTGANGIAVTAATFNVTGGANATFTLTPPTASPISLTGVGPAMSCALIYSAGIGTLSAAGTQTFYVGGTLSVGTSAAQTAGLYTTTFTVNVLYN